MENRFVQPAPLERLAIPGAIDGANGTNRSASSRPQIAAGSDVEAITAWLAMFLDKTTTFISYRKEAERLLLWSTIQIGKPISSLTHEDWLLYRAFLADPQPRERWVSNDGSKHPRPNPQWKPFAGPLAPSSQRQAAVILNAMFAWLVNAGYLAGNPLSLSRERKRLAAPRITRYLDEHLWQEVKATVDALPRESTRQQEHYARVRWLISLFYICGTRISEISATTMGGFFERRDRAGKERWWLEVIGKGDKIRIIPATGELMVELARYRSELGMAPLPIQGEPTPLLLPIGMIKRPLGRGGIHEIVKSIFAATAQRLRKKGAQYAGDAMRLERASAHWLRHTAGSHMANNAVDLRHIRDNLGHQSLSTTNTYLHSSDDARHLDTEEKHRIDW